LIKKFFSGGTMTGGTHSKSVLLFFNHESPFLYSIVDPVASLKVDEDWKLTHDPEQTKQPPQNPP
jgi:hypothetical protein